MLKRFEGWLLNKLAERNKVLILDPNKLLELPKCTRIEVIDHKGRAYTNYEASKVSISLQDNERTVKIFTNS